VAGIVAISLMVEMEGASCILPLQTHCNAVRVRMEMDILFMGSE